MKSKKLLAAVSVFIIVTVLMLPILMQVTSAQMPEFTGSKHLHMLPPALMEPIETTHWHELYPEFCNQYDLVNLADTNITGSYNGVADVGEQIALMNEETGKWEWYVVEWVTATIKIEYKADIKYLEFNGTWTEWYTTYQSNPVTTQWHEVYPVFSNKYPLIAHNDVNGDFKLTAGDLVDIGLGIWYNVDEVSTDIVVSLKPPRPALTGYGTRFMIVDPLGTPPYDNATNFQSANDTTFVVDIYIMNAPLTRAWEVTLLFNNLVLDVPVGPAEGTWLSSVNTTSFTYTPPLTASAYGKMAIGCTLIAPGAASGTGHLARVTFHVHNNGRSHLDLYDTILVDPNGVKTEYPNNDAFFATPPAKVCLHDVGILNVAANETEVQPGEQVNVTVTVFNQGWHTQHVLIKVYADWIDVYAPDDKDTVLIDELIIGEHDCTTMPPEPEGPYDPTHLYTLWFIWNTAALRGEEYTISAEIIKTEGVGTPWEDDDPHDNLFIGPKVKVHLAHDLKISEIKVLTPAVNQGELANITVTVANQGKNNERNFNITVKADNFEVGKINYTAWLNSQTDDTLLFQWDTTGKRGTYTISAEVDTSWDPGTGTVSDGETVDNTLTDGTVRVKVHDVRITSLSVHTHEVIGPAVFTPNGSELVLQVGIKNEGTEDEGPIIVIFLNFTKKYFLGYIPGDDPGACNVNYTVSPITLPAGEEIVMKVVWPTAGLLSGAPGIWLTPPIRPANYSVSVYVLPALGETNLADNYYYPPYPQLRLYTTVFSQYDINRDLKVTYADQFVALRASGGNPPFIPP